MRSGRDLTGRNEAFWILSAGVGLLRRPKELFGRQGDSLGALGAL